MINKIKALLLVVLCVASVSNVFAQRGDGAVAAPDNGFIPNAIYEIRYWTNMARMGDTDVYIDTMIFHGYDRASFEYSNAKCVSYHCRESDLMVYSLLPKFSSSNKEWTQKENFIRKMYHVTIPFRGHNRSIYKVYTADVDNKNTGLGDYSLVSREFGIIYRWNMDGEVFMLNRIEVMRNGKKEDEIDLLPMQSQLMTTDIFSGYDN